MRCPTMQPTVSCGLDLHVDWMDLGVIGADGEVRLHRNIRPDPNAFLPAVKPVREDGGVCVACLFTWSWMADLGEDEGSPLVLGHAPDRRAIPGGHATNDRRDSPTLAALRRGGLLPQASVDPRRRRATRALWRRRHHLRHQRAEWSAHLQQTARPSNLGEPRGRIATPQTRRGRSDRCAPRCGHTTRAVDLALVAWYEPLRADGERAIATTAHGHEPVSLARLRPRPGVGTRLARVRLSESEARARSPRVQACVSDGRLVKRARASHGTRHGPSGKQIGQAPRTGAVADAAGLVRQHHEPAQTSPTPMATSHGTGNARSILAHTRGRAVDARRKHPEAFHHETCLAPSGRRARSRPASHGSPRGQRHPNDAARRATRRVGPAPARAVPAPHVKPGILVRGVAVRSAPHPCRHVPIRRADGSAPFPSPTRTGRDARLPSPRR